MDAIQLLKKQHVEVEALFARYEKAETPDEKLEIFQQLGDNLAAHATIEEKVFYPVAYKDGDHELEDLLREAVEEHLAAKRLIADLLDLDPEEDAFDAKVKVLQEQIEHHIEEEEGDLFRKAKAVIPKEQLEMMGVEMEELFKAMLPGEPRFDVPAETSEAAPLE